MLAKQIKSVFWIASFILFVATLYKYPGEKPIYILFSVSLNLLLWMGLRTNKLFFDTFIGVFFWLGFWLKFSYRLLFFDGVFNDPVGKFDFSPESYDHSLMITSVGVWGLILCSVVREKVFFKYPSEFVERPLSGMFQFYEHRQKLCWFLFLALILAVSISNGYFGIYQKGTVPSVQLPYRLGGIYTWLLLFGLASFSAVLLDFEIRRKKKASLFVGLLSLFEAFCSNTSLLSRGMILNVSALLLGSVQSLWLKGKRLKLKWCLIYGSSFLALFALSVVFVEHFRYQQFVVNPVKISQPSVSQKSLKEEAAAPQVKSATTEKEQVNLYEYLSLIGRGMRVLLVDRWVGIEGVMSTSSYPHLGWKLWGDAWAESYSHSGTSMYDSKLAGSPFVPGKHLSARHFISLPGVLAFLFYPGSMWFLFFGMFIVGIVGATIEIFVYKFSMRNLILCSLIAQVVAYRFVHFGYVPKQSYLLFGAIILNILIFYAADKLLSLRFKVKAS